MSTFKRLITSNSWFRWSLDECVYEGIIESVNLKKNRIKVKFIGYDNEDTVGLDQLYSSRGEDWRDQQIEDAAYDLSEDITKLIEDSSEVFSQISDIQSFDKLAITENKENKQPAEKKEKKKKSEQEKSKKNKKEKEKRKDKIQLEDTPHIPFSEPLEYPFDLNSEHPFPDLSQFNSDLGDGFPSIQHLPGAFPSQPNLEREYPKPPASSQTIFPSLLIPPPPPPPNPFLAQGSDSAQHDEVIHNSD